MEEPVKTMTFDDTIEWASSNKKEDESSGILYYVLIGAVIIIALIIFIVMFSGNATKYLEMMRDEKYNYYVEDLVDYPSE